MFAPETDIKFLANCDVDPGQNNVRDFADKAAQAKYFSSKAKISLPKCAVMDIVGFSGVIKAPLGGNITIDSYYDCNYLMYRNSGISGKWFYAYLGTPQILNSGVALIPYSIDQWQTWCYDITIPQCFVEREIPFIDTVGSNLYPENVDTGEFVLCEEDSGGYDIAAGITQTASNKCVLIAYSFSASDEEKTTSYFVDEVTAGLRYEFPGLKPVFSGGYLDSGVYQANLYIWVDVSDQSTVDSKINLINSFVEKLIGEGQVEKIKYIKMVPRVLCEGLEYKGIEETATEEEAAAERAKNIPPNTVEPKHIPRIGKPSPVKFGQYTPECNKLYTQQFNYSVISNGGGSTLELGYEYFSGDDTKFTLYSMAGDNPTLMLVANGYKCIADKDNFLYTLSIDNFPSGSIGVANAYNEYNAKLARSRYTKESIYDTLSSGKMGFEYIGDFLHGASTGYDKSKSFTETLNDDNAWTKFMNGYIGSISNAVNIVGGFHGGIKEDVEQIGDGSLPYPRQPNSIVGDSGTDLPFAIGVKSFRQYRMQIQEQYARKIDNYFKAYGYKTNQFKVPSMKGRPKWNYVKCVNPVIKGNIPMEAKIAISQMLTNGLRFWHSGAVWMDYSQRNK